MDVSKGFFAVYVGETENKRLVIPVSYLNLPSFEALLRQAGKKYRFDHPMGCLTTPCTEEIFIDLTICLNGL